MTDKKHRQGPRLDTLEGDAESVLERRATASQHFIELLTNGDPATRARLENVLTALMPEDGDLAKVEHILSNLDERQQISGDRTELENYFNLYDFQPSRFEVTIQELLTDVRNTTERGFDPVRFTRSIGALVAKLGSAVDHVKMPEHFRQAALRYLSSVMDEIVAYERGTGPQGPRPETITIDHAELVDLEYPHQVGNITPSRYEATIVTAHTHPIQNLHHHLIRGMKKAILESLYPRQY